MRHISKLAILFSLVGGVFCSTSFGQASPTVQELVESGRQYGLNKQYDKAIEAYQAALKIDPNLFAAQAGLGASLIGAGRNGEAVGPLRSAVSLDPKNLFALMNLGTAYLNLRRWDDAINAFTEALKIQPNDARIYNRIGQAAVNAGKFEDAISYFKKACELVPNDAGDLYNVGLTYNVMGRYADAIEPLKTASRGLPNDKNIWFALGQAYSKTGHYSDAIDAYTKYLEIAPDENKALVSRSQNYLYLGNAGREAARDAQRYLTLYNWRTQDSPYLAVVAILGLREAGAEADAQSVITQALKKVDGGTWAYNIIRFFDGEINADDFLKFAANNDQRTEAHVYIAMDLKLKGKSDEAKTHFQWAKEYGNSRFVEYSLALAELSRY